MNLNIPYRFIHSKNRAGLGYSLAVNHFADMSHFELKRMRGYINSRKPNNAVPFGRADQRIRNLPDTVDWRLYGNYPGSFDEVGECGEDRK